MDPPITVGEGHILAIVAPLRDVMGETSWIDFFNSPTVTMSFLPPFFTPVFS